MWLDVACLYRTRSQAAAACKGGKVDVNGQAASPHKLVHAGDALSITLEEGRRTFVIRGVAERHVRRIEARALYEETTPPLPPEVIEARRLERLLAPRRDEGKGRLSKQERRDRERWRGF